MTKAKPKENGPIQVGVCKKCEAEAPLADSGLCGVCEAQAHGE